MLSVYAKTTTTRRLLAAGRLAHLFSRPVVVHHVSPWCFVGFAKDFRDATVLCEQREAEGRVKKRVPAGAVSDLPVLSGKHGYAHLVCESRESSSYQACEPRDRDTREREDDPSEDASSEMNPDGSSELSQERWLQRCLQWYRYTGGGPLDGWTPIERAC
jgi:hypothetical protein